MHIFPFHSFREEVQKVPDMAEKENIRGADLLENILAADLQTEEKKRGEIERNIKKNTGTVNTVEKENVPVTKTVSGIAAGKDTGGDKFLNFLLEWC